MTRVSSTILLRCRRQILCKASMFCNFLFFRLARICCVWIVVGCLSSLLCTPLWILNLYPCVNVVVVYVHPPSPYPCDLLCVICSFLAGTSPCVYISGRSPSVGSGTVGSAYFSWCGFFQWYIVHSTFRPFCRAWLCPGSPTSVLALVLGFCPRCVAIVLLRGYLTHVWRRRCAIDIFSWSFLYSLCTFWGASLLLWPGISHLLVHSVHSGGICSFCFSDNCTSFLLFVAACFQTGFSGCVPV